MGVRLGVIGAGWWATTNHLPLLQSRDDVEFVGVATLGADRLEAVRQKFAFRHATQDYRELLEQDLDAVIVSSPHHLHYEHARAALDAGLHVMCEKPMTLHGEQAWDLVHRAERTNRHLLVPYGWHYLPFVGQARELVADGGLGTVHYALCHMASPTKSFFSGTGGIPTQWVPTLSEPDPSTWQDPANGGGYAHGQLTHSTAMLLWITGLRAAEVAARAIAPRAPVDLFDAGWVRFDGDAIGSLSGAATLPDDDPFQVDLRVFGEEGVLLLDTERSRLDLRRHNGQHVHVDLPPDAGRYRCDGPPHRFIDLVLGGGEDGVTNESPGEVAARSVELIEALHESSGQQGQPVAIRR